MILLLPLFSTLKNEENDLPKNCYTTIESIVPRNKFGVSWNPSGWLEDKPAQWMVLGLIIFF